MSQKFFIVSSSTLTDEDMRAAPGALCRAAKRAHKITHHTGTGVTVIRDGEVAEN